MKFYFMFYLYSFIFIFIFFPILVAPKQLTVKVRPEKLRPGQMVTITCESDSSNPVSRLTWLRGNGQVIQPAGNSTVPGAYSGIVSKSTLQMEVTPELHGVVITCQATNGIGPQIHDAITLEVLCKSPLSTHVR